MRYRKPQQGGFTLIELMVVVVIIGIFCALSIPGILEIRYRNTLSDSTERVRSVAQTTRDIAMETRNAVVMEVTATSLWINLLSGPSCQSTTIQKRCTSSVAESSGTVPLFETGADGLGQAAGVHLCGGVALAINSGSGNCDVGGSLNVSDGFALCYSGKGELWYRVGGDSNTVCPAPTGSALGSPPANANWVRSCSVDPTIGLGAVDLPDGSTTDLTEGVVLMLNRYEGTSCSASDAIDVMRLVKLPTNGAPFSELSI
jgi:prepilin-type N-terminal cleavage/methylation domain-containing protein